MHFPGALVNMIFCFLVEFSDFDRNTVFKVCFSTFQLNSLTLMELNTFRPFLTDALNHLHMLRSNVARAASQKSSQE